MVAPAQPPSRATLVAVLCRARALGSLTQPRSSAKVCACVYVARCMCVRCMLDVRTLHVACLHQLLCLAVCQVCVLFTLLLHLAAAVNCTATNLDFTAGVSRLVGTTSTSTSVSCAPGYSIGGGNSTLTTQSYSCLALLAGASSWSPNPAQVRCQGAYATLFSPNFSETSGKPHFQDFLLIVLIYCERFTRFEITSPRSGDLPSCFRPAVYGCKRYPHRIYRRQCCCVLPGRLFYWWIGGRPNHAAIQLLCNWPSC